MKKKYVIGILVVLILVIGVAAFIDYKNKNLLIKEAGTFDITKKYQTITIEADGVILKNANADEITVHEKVADGTVRLENVSIKKLIINGGGTDSIYVEGDSSIDEIKIKRKDKAVHLHLDTTVKNKKVNIDGGKDKVILSGIYRLVNLNTDSLKIEFKNATVADLNMNSKDNDVSIDNKTTIKNLNIKDVVRNTVNVKGIVENLVVSEDAKNSRIIVDNKILNFKNLAGTTSLVINDNAIVEIVRTDNELNITGNGDIKAAVVSNKEILITEIKPGIIEIDDNIDKKIILPRDSYVVTKPIIKPVVNPYVAVESIKLEKNNMELIIGDEQIIAVDILPINASNKKISYTSNNTNVVTVSSDGKIKAVGIGNAKVTIIVDGKKVVCNITVKPCPVSSVEFDIVEDKLTLTQELKLTATIYPQIATNKEVVYTSSDESIATVDENGKVIANGVGEVIITATTVDGNKTATATIKINNFLAISNNEKTLYNTFVELLLDINNMVNPEIYLGSDVELSSMILFDKALTIDGLNHKISAIHTGNQVININTNEEIILNNLSIYSQKSNNQRAISIINNEGLNLKLENVNIYTNGRGITFDNGFINGNLDIIKSNIYNSRTGIVNYDTDVSIDGGSRGISVWNAKNSILNIENSKILGFGYVIQISGDKVNNIVDSTGFIMNITDSQLKGWGGLCIYESYSTYNIKNTLIRGVNTSSGSSNGFSAININYGYTDKKQDITMIIEDSKIEAYNSGVSLEWLFTIPDYNPFKVFKLINVEFEYASDFSGQQDEIISTDNVSGVPTAATQELVDTIMAVSEITNVTGTNKLGDDLVLFYVEESIVDLNNTVEDEAFVTIDNVVEEITEIEKEIIVADEAQSIENNSSVNSKTQEESNLVIENEPNLEDNLNIDQEFNIEESPIVNETLNIDDSLIKNQFEIE